MQIKFTSLLPKQFGNRVIIISALVHLIVYITLICLFPLDQLKMTEAGTPEYWQLRIVRDFFFAVFVICMIVFGIREARGDSKDFKLLILPVYGVLLCSSLIFSSWYGERAFSDVKNTFSEQNIVFDDLKKRLENLGPDSSIEKKMESTKFFAKKYYQWYGEQIEYLTQDETYTLYEPTEEDKDKYKEYLNEIRYLNWS